MWLNHDQIGRSTLWKKKRNYVTNPFSCLWLYSYIYFFLSLNVIDSTFLRVRACICLKFEYVKNMTGRGLHAGGDKTDGNGRKRGGGGRLNVYKIALCEMRLFRWRKIERCSKLNRPSLLFFRMRNATRVSVIKHRMEYYNIYTTLHIIPCIRVHTYIYLYIYCILCEFDVVTPSKVKSSINISPWTVGGYPVEITAGIKPISVPQLRCTSIPIRISHFPLIYIIRVRYT